MSVFNRGMHPLLCGGVYTHLLAVVDLPISWNQGFKRASSVLCSQTVRLSDLLSILIDVPDLIDPTNSMDSIDINTYDYIICG